MPRAITNPEPDRRIGPKGLGTRECILVAACRLFSERGYEGTGIRDIESAAEVKRGVVTYHFGKKEDVWKAVVDYSFSPYVEQFRQQRDLIKALDPDVRLRFLVRGFIVMSSEKPYINQLMIQESLANTWRIDWIIAHFIAPMRELFQEALESDPRARNLLSNPHQYYALLGACVHVFSLRAEVNALYRQDTSDASFAERHVDAVLALFGPWIGTLAP